MTELPAKPTILKPSSRWTPLNLREVWEFRDLFRALAARDIKVRYKQTILGGIWVILQPLIGAGIFTFVFGVMAQLPTGGIPPFLISFAGMFAWTAFSQTLSRVSGCMVGNSALVSKIYFPRLILPMSQVAGVLVDLSVSFAMVLVLLLIYGINPGVQFLLLPVWLMLLFMFALGVGMWSAALMVSYRDVRYILPVATQFLLYASPVGYTLVAVSDRVPEWIVPYYMLNPLASLVEATRWSMLGRGTLPTGYLAYSIAVALIVFTIGAFSFKRMEKRFADVI